MNQLANILRRTVGEGHSVPSSMFAMGSDVAAALQGWLCATRWGRLSPHGSRTRLRVVFRFARLALLARCAMERGGRRMTGIPGATRGSRLSRPARLHAAAWASAKRHAIRACVPAWPASQASGTIWSGPHLGAAESCHVMPDPFECLLVVLAAAGRVAEDPGIEQAAARQ